MRPLAAIIGDLPSEAALPELAFELLSKEATRLGTSTDTLLDPNQVGHFYCQSPLLQRILKFFEFQVT